MQWSIFDKIWGVWIADETLSRVFQSKQKLMSKQRSKIVNEFEKFIWKKLTRKQKT